MFDAVRVYVAYNAINGKEYVGITKRTVAKRAEGHKRVDSRGCPAFGRAIRKYGFENFKFEEVFVAFNWNDACWAEKTLIAERQTRVPFGYNLTDGGGGSPGTKVPKRSDKWREKQSEAHKGKKRSVESVAKTAASLRGKPRSPETWEKIRAGHERYMAERKAGNLPIPPGRKPSEEARKKMSEAQKRRFAAMSPEEMEKAYESRRDGRMSVMAKAREEQKRLAGYTVSDEARRKISEAAMRRSASERSETAKKAAAARWGRKVLAAQSDI